jgi:hypothetical protein
MSVDQEKLAKLLLMLSSDQPGEVVSAARAIGRTLQGAGSNGHDFAARLLPTRLGARERPDDDSNPFGPGPNRWRGMHKFCRERDAQLRPRERDFIKSLGTWRGALSEKQLNWLTAIYQRLHDP